MSFPCHNSIYISSVREQSIATDLLVLTVVMRYSKILLDILDMQMGRGRPFQCEITVSSGVREKLLKKHSIELWEIEEILYEDKHAFSITYRDLYFIYGQTFSGRYLLVLVRILSSEEVIEFGYEQSSKVVKIITARDMNRKQRKLYNQRKGTN